MKKRHPYLFVSALMILLAFAACSPSRSDSEITGDALTRVHADASLANSAINVQTTNGVVTLTGNVATETARSAAENTVKQIQGVKGVVNNIQIVAAVATPPPAIESLKPVTQASRSLQPSKPKSAPAKRVRVRQPASPVAASTPPPPTQASPSPTPETVLAQATPPAVSEPSVTQTPTPPALPETVTIPEGTTIPIRLIDPVDTEKNKEGDTFRASLDAPILMNDKTVIPKDADVEARLVSAKSAGRFTGSSKIALVLTRIAVGTKVYPLQTGEFTKQGGSRGKRSAIVIGGGAAAGAAIGGIVGGGKGAAIGGAAGAAAGTGVQAITKGEQVKLPAETLLEFQLKAPLTVTPIETGGN